MSERRSVDDLKRWLLDLQALLDVHGHFWRRSPFHDHTPAWAYDRPELTCALLALPQDTVSTLSSDTAALHHWLTPWMPTLAPLERLCRVDARPDVATGPERFFAHVPGSKRAQVEAFAEAATENVGNHPWLEWCAGKGHLGRWLVHRSGGDALSLEIDSALCVGGRTLAHRTGTNQRFECVDVLRSGVQDTLTGRHAVALHACGDLHLRLIALVSPERVPALDIAPCCYDRTEHPYYIGLNPEARLQPDRLALRLAVTDMRANSRGERSRWHKTLAWKLAYKRAREDYIGVNAAEPLESTPRAWARLSFPQWCQAMAARDDFTFRPGTDWEQLEQMGKALRHRFGRLNLPRLAFRRGLEMWLVLDMALYLARQGYRASISAFCSDALTPRNLLVSARRGDLADGPPSF